MSVKTANGFYQFAGGQDTVDLDLLLIGTAVTLTNALQADGFVNADSGYITVADLRPFRQVRLLGRVGTVSASANSPKIQLRYSTSWTTTVGSFAQLGASSVEFSMFTGATMGNSGWIDLAAAARVETCYLGLFNIGGDGAADPVISQVRAQFR